jgi:hypothetical protein
LMSSLNLPILSYHTFINDSGKSCEINFLSSAFSAVPIIRTP